MNPSIPTATCSSLGPSRVVRRSLLRGAAGRVAKLVGAVATVALFTVVGHDTSRADSTPTLPGWMALGQVTLDKTGCSSCPAVITTSRRHRGFGLASDTPFALTQTGRVDVTCADGWSYHVFLQSPRRGGLFQVIPNSCVNLDSKEIKLTITSVGLSPPDAERTVSLITYGSFG